MGRSWIWRLDCITTARYYDPKASIFVNVDPLVEKTLQPYAYANNNPVRFVDPDGKKAAPIYDTEGNFLGTDDLGLQGKAIIMNKQDFKQGMSHKDALSKSKGYEGLHSKEAKNRFQLHYKSLPSRPDYDGYLTKKEADDWWKGKSGSPLFVDQKKIVLPGITTKDFKNTKGESIYKNFIWGLSETGKVYGTLKMTLSNVDKGEVHIGGEKFMDEYDFTMDGRTLRDFATWVGRPGEENDGKSFIIYGYGKAIVPIKK